METGTTETVDETKAYAAARPRVVTRFWDYSPPFDVASIVERMLGSVPPRYLLGLRDCSSLTKPGSRAAAGRSVTRVPRAQGQNHDDARTLSPDLERQAGLDRDFRRQYLGRLRKGVWRSLLLLGLFPGERTRRSAFSHEVGPSYRRDAPPGVPRKRKTSPTTGATGSGGKFGFVANGLGRYESFECSNCQFGLLQSRWQRGC